MEAAATQLTSRCKLLVATAIFEGAQLLRQPAYCRTKGAQSTHRKAQTSSSTASEADVCHVAFVDWQSERLLKHVHEEEIAKDERGDGTARRSAREWCSRSHQKRRRTRFQKEVENPLRATGKTMSLQLLACLLAAPSPSLLQLTSSSPSPGYATWHLLHDVVGVPPSSRWGGAAAYDPVGLRALFFGGCEPSTSSKPVCSGATHALRPGTSTWSELATTAPPSARYGASASVVGGALAVFGGNADGAATNELVQLELTKLRWERPKLMGKLPAPRQEHAAAAVGDELWIHGGSSDAGFFDDLWRLRRAADGGWEGWTVPKTSGPAPTARKGHSMALMHSRLYVFGGAATACTDSTVYALDTKTLAWQSFAKATGAAPTPREGAIWLALHERLLLFGGCDFRGAKGAPGPRNSFRAEFSRAIRRAIR